jgi:hypothetical protein
MPCATYPSPAGSTACNAVAQEEAGAVASSVRSCRIIGVVYFSESDAPPRPCTIDVLHDDERVWTISYHWHDTDEFSESHGDDPAMSALIQRLLAQAPAPAGEWPIP